MGMGMQDREGGTSTPTLQGKVAGGYAGNGGGKRKHEGGGSDIEDRHYSPTEYLLLPKG
jgi:hypothetical protein